MERLRSVVESCISKDDGREVFLRQELEKEKQGLQAVILQVTGERSERRRDQISSASRKRQKTSYRTEAIPSSELQIEILELLQSIEKLLQQYGQRLVDHHAISLYSLYSTYCMIASVRLFYFSVCDRGFTEITHPMGLPPLMLSQGKEQQIYLFYHSLREFTRALTQIDTQPHMTEQMIANQLRTSSTSWSHPLRCQASYLAGYSLLQRGEYEQALLFFRSCYQENYQKVPCVCAIVACLCAMDKPMEAVDQLEQVGFNMDENEPEITSMFLYNIGVLYQHMRVWNSASDVYSHLFPLLQDPSNSMKAMQQGQIIQLAERDSIVGEIPHSFVYYQLATVALHCKQYTKAAVAFSRIFGDSRRPIVSFPTLNIKRIYHEFMYSLLACQDYEHVIQVSEQLLAQDNTDLVSLLYQSDAQFSLGRLDDSVHTLTTAVKIIQQNSLPQENSGGLCLSYVRSALMNNFALVLVCQGNARKAQETIHEIRNLPTNNTDDTLRESMKKTLTYNYCTIAFRRGQAAEACSCWFPFRAIQLNGDYEYYQSLLSSHTANFRTMRHHEPEPNSHYFPEPSHYQIGLMTEMCLRYWLSRSREQMQATGRILSFARSTSEEQQV